MYGNAKGRSRTGAFEVTTSKGDLIWSKLEQTKRKPTSEDIDQIVQAVGVKMGL